MSKVSKVLRERAQIYQEVSEDPESGMSHAERQIFLVVALDLRDLAKEYDKKKEKHE